MATLKPVFPQWGEASTTAGNASGVGDGAALCILASRERAEKEGLPIIAKYVGTAVVGVEPRYMGIAPVYAVPKVLEAYGLKKEDIDVYEVRQAVLRGMRGFSLTPSSRSTRHLLHNSHTVLRRCKFQWRRSTRGKPRCIALA